MASIGSPDAGFGAGNFELDVDRTMMFSSTKIIARVNGVAKFANVTRQL
ncbi:MAG: hypothetical protein R3C26_19405 [Calditrichia bacterium]